MVRSLFSRLKRLIIPASGSTLPASVRLSSKKQHNRGFTLLELIVVVAIAGALVSGLMFIVVQLMQADQRESARTETQREMQLAMDYISTELREAVFVYTGDDMPRLAQYLPADLTATGTMPVIAFWKYHPFPDAVRNACASATPPVGVGCMSGQSYALVVYSLTRNPRNAGSPWKGGARITRYALTQFQGNSTAQTSGYVNPGDASNFPIWPLDADRRNLQTARPTASAGTINTLVDFVDGQTDAFLNTAIRCPGSGAENPYTLSPPDSMLNGLPRSFAACISSSRVQTSEGSTQNLQTVGEYQDVILYLRGSAVGRPGVSNNLTARSAELLPTLETRVMLRGVLTRRPPS